jgi:hypothetical protein
LERTPYFKDKLVTASSNTSSADLVRLGTCPNPAGYRVFRDPLLISLDFS